MKDINYVTTWGFCIYPTVSNGYTSLIKTPAFLCYLKFTPEVADLNFIAKLILLCWNFRTIYGGAIGSEKEPSCCTVPKETVPRRLFIPALQ